MDATNSAGELSSCLSTTTPATPTTEENNGTNIEEGFEGSGEEDSDSDNNEDIVDDSSIASNENIVEDSDDDSLGDVNVSEDNLIAPDSRGDPLAPLTSLSRQSYYDDDEITTLEPRPLNALTEFTWFAKLPPELRQKCWVEACLEPRILDIFNGIDVVDVDQQAHFTELFGRERLGMKSIIGRKAPAILRKCLLISARSK
jgi:hypothetical protein